MSNFNQAEAKNRFENAEQFVFDIAKFGIPFFIICNIIYGAHIPTLQEEIQKNFTSVSKKEYDTYTEATNLLTRIERFRDNFRKIYYYSSEETFHTDLGTPIIIEKASGVPDEIFYLANKEDPQIRTLQKHLKGKTSRLIGAERRKINGENYLSSMKKLPIHMGNAIIKKGIPISPPNKQTSANRYYVRRKVNS